MIRKWWLWIADEPPVRVFLVALTFSYAVVLGLRFQSMAANFYLSADVAYGPVLARALAAGHAGPIYLSANNYFSNIWFDSIVASLPLHRVLWEIEPVLAMLGSAAALTMVCGRIWGRRWAPVCGVLSVCIAPAVLLWSMSQTAHSTATATAVIFGISAQWLVSHRSAKKLACVSAATAIVGGANLASDPLVWICGLIPFTFAITAAAVFDKENRSVIVRQGTIVLVGTFVAMVAVLLAIREAGVVLLPAGGIGFGAAGLGQLPKSLPFLINSIPRLAGGPMLTVSWSSPLTWWAVVLATGAVLLAATGLFAARPQKSRRPNTQIVAHLAFWWSAMVLLVSAYLFSGFAQDNSSIRYLIPLVFCLAALLPAASWAGPKMRGAAVALAMGWATTVLAGIISHPPTDFTYGDARIPRIATFLESHALYKGYASFWDSTPVTYATDGRVQVAAVLQGEGCGDKRSAKLCRSPALSAESWYRPGNGPTFLLLQPGEGCLSGPPPLDDGSPIATYQVYGFTVLVYKDDIARRLVPSRFPLCPAQ